MESGQIPMVSMGDKQSNVIIKVMGLQLGEVKVYFVSIQDFLFQQNKCSVDRSTVQKEKKLTKV